MDDTRGKRQETKRRESQRIASKAQPKQKKAKLLALEDGDPSAAASGEEPLSAASGRDA